MEDSLGRRQVQLFPQEGGVLILVVMEDSLGPQTMFADGSIAKRLNPCCNGR